MCAYTTVVTVVVILLCANSNQAKCKGFVFPRYTIEILNGIGPEICVRCKSKDDDLGRHYVAFEQAYYFSFRVSFLTLFYCSASWNGRTEYFDAYNVRSEDSIFCRENGCCCSWKLTPDGPCLFIKASGKHDRCHPWKPKDENIVKLVR
uniref:S-protein homolog n=1 Tax=Kalanchoe fedtschenkoi TaxID=63787 RepID=A0A7N0TPA1_KALFE